MALRDISIKHKTITFGDNSFEVRGLSFADLMAVFAAHKEQVAAIFALVNNLDNEDGIDAMLSNVFEVAPDAINLAVALAADEPEMIDVVRSLPLPVATEAALAVSSLTFESEADLVNFIDGLTEVVSKAADKVKPKA